MRISNSKLNTILSCPMTYYLTYIEKIKVKDKSPALAIGSAVHKALEDGQKFDKEGNPIPTDLTEYFKENGNMKQKMEYSFEQMLSECMADGYFKHKDEIYDQILNYNGEKLQIIEEYHELELYAKLPSDKYDNEFYGIIDLLLLTNKGFIILDYKTSSDEPDWVQYLEQIYRYIFLIKFNFPDFPILKIGIINLRKTKLRKKIGENDTEYRKRIKFEYDFNDERYINYHEYLADELDPKLIDMYINNLYVMCDGASEIVEGENWFINFTNANGKYKSQFWDIFYQTEGCENLYNIEDEDIVEGKLQEITRDCVKIDTLTVFGNLRDKIVNKYSKYKNIRLLNKIEGKKFKQYLKNKGYITDETLLDNYEQIFEKEVKNEESHQMV